MLNYIYKMYKTDISNRDDVFKLVDAFYKKVRQDEILGPFFNEKIKEAKYQLAVSYFNIERLITYWKLDKLSL